MKPEKKNNKTTFMILTALTIVAVALIYMFVINKKSDDPMTESINIKFNSQGSLTFYSAENDDEIATIGIEVADNVQLRARGLMYRNSLPADGGMLFIFDREEIQGFWMKNTYIALDMLFVNREKEIVTIHANTTPMKEWNYASTEPALYVVEVNAGYCLRHNIKAGDRIEFVLDKR